MWTSEQTQQQLRRAVKESQEADQSSLALSSSNPYDEEKGPSSLNRDERGYVDALGNPNSMYNFNNGTVDPNSIEAEELRNIEHALAHQQRVRNNKRLELSTDFLADLSFFFGSTMYLWLAVSQSKDVLFSEDTIGDDSGSGDKGLFLDDQVLFSFRGGESKVTLYILYGFSSGLLMFASGFLRLFTTAFSPTDKIPCVMMLLAAFFAMVSSALMVSQPVWSNRCYSIAIHLFALQAATLLLWRTTSPGGLAGVPWTRLVGDCLFFIATLGGIALSYLYVFEATDRLPFASEYLVVFSYSVWWVSSVVYLSQTTCLLIRREKQQKASRGTQIRCGCCHRRRDAEEGGDEGSLQKSLPQEDTQSTNEDGNEVEEHYQRHSNGHQRIGNENVGAPDDEQSVMSLWTAGPGPENKEQIASSSLDNIFGRST